MRVENRAQSLGELGYVDGENVSIAYRWAGGHNERLPALAAELVSLPVAVIAALNGSASALALKTLTKSVPIVFQTGGDAAELGLLTNLNRPEGNLTGVSGITNFLVAQQLDLLRQLFPGAKSFALLTNPASPNANSTTKTRFQDSISPPLICIPAHYSGIGTPY